MYKINIHAHTFFSDGRNSPLVMAKKAKELGFTALVLTDHYYGGRHPECELTFEKLKLYNKAIIEAREVLPVIRGLEVAFGGEEFLLFGGSAIKWLLATNGLNTKDDLVKMKKEHHCAMVLCHPQNSYHNFLDCLDGYERYNGGQDWFKRREVGELSKLTGWCNSDAHSVDSLEAGYNLVNKKIVNEGDLINYIKKGEQPRFVVRGEER